MADNLLDGLNSLVNIADKPEAAKKPAAAKAEKPAADRPADDLSRRILDRLDGIKASVDALRQAGPVPGVENPATKPTEKPVAGPEGKPARPPAEKPAPVRPSVPKAPPDKPVQAMAIVDLWPYLVLVSAALELVAFALGMGYGAIVAAGKYPYWYRPGATGALIDWIAAPAGILLLPVIAGLLALGGAELRREGRESAAKAVWAVAVAVAVVAFLAPFFA